MSSEIFFCDNFFAYVYKGKIRRTKYTHNHYNFNLNNYIQGNIFVLYQHSLWRRFQMVPRNLVYFCFLYERVPRFYDCHVIKFFWQILKYFLDFKTNKNFSYTWDLFRIRNKNVNNYFVKIYVD